MSRHAHIASPALLTCVFALAAVEASGDVTIEERLSVEGAGVMRMANMSGRTTTIISGDRARMENDLQMQSRLMRTFARGMGPTAEIVRLDQDRIYQLELGKKQYTETSFAELRAQLETAMQQAAKAQPAPTAIDESQCEWSSPKSEVKRTGEKTSIAGYDAERLNIVASQACTDKKSGQVCEFALVLDQWLAPEFAGGEETMKFHQAYAEKMGFAAGGSRDFAQRAEAMFGRYEGIWKEIAQKVGDVRGYPVKSSFALAIGGPQCQTTTAGDPAAPGATPGATQGAVATAVGEAAGETVAHKAGESALGGVAGRLGGKIAGSLFGRKKAEKEATAEEPAKPAVPATINGLIPFLTVSSELLSVSRAPAAPGAFEVPADFKKVTQKN